MKIIFMSDTHNSLNSNSYKKLSGDLLIHSGDLTYIGNPDRFYQQLSILNSLDFDYIIYTPGNHDSIFECDPSRAYSIINKFPKIICLINQSIVVKDLHIYGMPYTPRFGDWAFMYDRNSLQMKEVCENIPDNLDILITHGPPLGILDTCPSHQFSDVDVNVGCEVLLEEVKKKNPRIHCFGHIHESYGIVSNDSTLFINAAMRNDRTKDLRSPISVKLKREELFILGKRGDPTVTYAL